MNRSPGSCTVEERLARCINLGDFQGEARPLLPKMAYEYYAGGSESEWTLRENRSAFSKYRLLPRVLRDVSKVDTSLTLFGHRLASPVMVAPLGFQRMAHPEGECATARATADMNSLMVLSTMSTTPLEEVAQAPDRSQGSAPMFFQLYVLRDRDITRQLVERAERAGFSAVVMTVDTPITGSREADTRNRFQLPPGISLGNLGALQASSLSADQGGSGLTQLFGKQIDDSLTFKDIEWLRTITKLPILVKGVMRGSDALEAVKHGASGIIVSNHGGRQADYAPATIDVLQEVVSKVGDQVPVLLDGGIRRGTDVLKALALGAKAVLVGRPVIWGLACGGEKGVAKVLKILQDEVKLAMMLNGCATLREVNLDLILGPSVHHHHAEDNGVILSKL